METRASVLFMPNFSIYHELKHVQDRPDEQNAHPCGKDQSQSHDNGKFPKHHIGFISLKISE
ncbi:MAG: hypothetical protein GX221_05840 [Candidatus Riflebacteria bacterium]|nr:hypothetical protein [Candidatus Riflebacteria bacterium]